VLAATLDKLYTLAPLVIAHRGASFSAPENTLAAFGLAREIGADGIELDTSLTSDDIPVVIHNLTLEHTTNGTGPVRDLDLSAIKALDAGSHFSPKFRGEQIPTLDEVFETIGPQLIVNIELKSISSRANGLEPAVASVIQRHNAGQRVIVSSFNPFALRRFRTAALDIPLGYLVSPDEPLYLRQDWLLAGVRYQARHPEDIMVDAHYMAKTKRRGYRVNVWTVDDPERIIQLQALGVDGIITNRPDVALQALGRGR